MQSRHVKPTSLTWWASVAPLVAGLVLATEPLHEWAALADTTRNLVGDVSPSLLINAGLAGIGIRGALR